MKLTTPIVFIIFNRPEQTKRVFEVIAQAKPKRLFVVADGPRFSEEEEKCQKTRAIIEKIDWECELLTNFSNENMGCGRRIASGLDWVFDKVEKAIILEDDCLPSLTFFQFCEELLERYREDNRILHINGNNFASSSFIKTEYSYHFCSYPQAWGWATWRRAWKMFDGNLTFWPIIKEGQWLKEKGWTTAEHNIQIAKFDKMYKDKPKDIWDYMWHCSVFCQHGLAIVPKQNLISNIGFSTDATHTKFQNPAKAELRTTAIEFPLVHPPIVMPDYKIDNIYKKMMILEPKLSFFGRIRNKITTLLQTKDKGN